MRSVTQLVVRIINLVNDWKYRVRYLNFSRQTDITHNIFSNSKMFIERVLVFINWLDFDEHMK